MDLKEYELGGRTYLFDSANVPEGAKLVVRDKPAAEKKAPTPQNKQAHKPNKTEV